MAKPVHCPICEEEVATYGGIHAGNSFIRCWHCGYKGPYPTNPSKGKITGKELLRNIVLNRSEGICFHCNVHRATEIDHIIPRICGGPDEPWNYVHSCGHCNRSRPRYGQDLKQIADKLPAQVKEMLHQWMKENHYHWVQGKGFIRGKYLNNSRRKLD